MTPNGGAIAQLAPRAPGRRSGAVLRQVLWASVPIWSIGFLSFAPFLAYAIIQRRKPGLGGVRGLPGGDRGHDRGAGVGRLRQRRRHRGGRRLHHRPGGLRRRPRGHPVPARAAPASPSAGRASGAGPRQHNQDAIAEAKSRIERRKDARHLAETDPALARDLGVGRPDLPRDYDDGGLVDVNHVPGDVLAAHLGLASHEVTDVLAARDKLGRFTSADELCAYTDLSPDRVDELRDLMIFS